MTNGENDTPMKDAMQKVGAKFEEKWDIDNNKQFDEKWDVIKTTKFEEKWNSDKNSGNSSQKKNTVLKEIWHDVAGVFSEKWDSHHDEKQKGDGSAAKGGEEDEQKNASSANDDNSADKQETASVESRSTTSGSPTSDNPYVQAPVPTSQFEWESESSTKSKS